MSEFELSALAEHLNAKIVGDPSYKISGIAPLSDANASHISFLDNKRYRKYLSECKAGAVLVREMDVKLCPSHALVVEDPYLSYAKVAHLFAPKSNKAPGIHPSTVVAETATIHESVHIGPHCVIGDHVRIAEGVVIEAGCVINDACEIGANSYLYPRVTCYQGTTVGSDAIIHSGVVLGADGFGIAKDKTGWLKIPQLGRVIIGNEVEIGANTTIDRGALNNTVIGNGVKLDNQIMIGHNVQIGDYTAVAGCAGICGSTKIGKNCLIGGGVGINGHIEICDNVMITGMSSVSNSIEEPGVYSSGLPTEDNKTWRRNVARFKQLDKVFEQVKSLTSERDQ